jgi:hypothetical protein
MIGWLSKRYGFEMPEIDFHFDKENKKYVFNNIE